MLRKIMQNLLIGLGVVFLLYFLVLMAKGVDFGIVWLPAGGFLLALGCYLRYRWMHPDGFRLPPAVSVGIGVLAAVGILLFVTVECRIFGAMIQKPEKNLDYVIVLGAQVKKETPSLALRKRLRAAQEYLQENPGTIAVLSGGKGDGEDISEALCMFRYLTDAGIAEDRLRMEDASTTTLENLSFSAEILSREGAGMESRIGIITNNFHVYRALRLAKHMGYSDAHGIAAESDWRLQAHYLVREFFALVKEKISGNI